MPAKDHRGFRAAGRAGLLLLLALLAGACARAPESRQYGRILMGTRAGVRVYGLDEARGQAVADAVFAEWARLEKVFSAHDPDSELSFMNRGARKGWTPVSGELYDRVAEALRYHTMTEGRFDATFGPVWELWRRCEKADRLPAETELAEARSRTGSGAIRLDPERRAVRFLKPVSVDLGGTVKDYALRRGQAVLESALRKRVPVLLDLGGDLLAWGAKKPPWSVGVRHPSRDGVLGVLRFPAGGAVLTSGSYERFVEIAGRRFCHILDARTGRPLEGFSSFTLAVADAAAPHPPSVVLVLMGRDAGLSAVRTMPGALGVWADAEGRVEAAAAETASVSWTPG